MEDYSITQKYIRRYPKSKRTKSWIDKMVHIRTDHGIWRVQGEGYTILGRGDEWVLPFEKALEQVNDLGPEKKAMFIDSKLVGKIIK